MAKTATKEKEQTTNEVKGMFIQKIQLKEGRGIIIYSNDTDNALNAGTFTGKDECTEEFKVLFSVVYTFTKRGNVINISTG